MFKKSKCTASSKTILFSLSHAGALENGLKKCFYEPAKHPEPRESKQKIPTEAYKNSEDEKSKNGLDQAAVKTASFYDKNRALETLRTLIFSIYKGRRFSTLHFNLESIYSFAINMKNHREKLFRRKVNFKVESYHFFPTFRKMTRCQTRRQNLIIIAWVPIWMVPWTMRFPTTK